MKTFNQTRKVCSISLVQLKNFISEPHIGVAKSIYQVILVIFLTLIFNFISAWIHRSTFALNLILLGLLLGVVFKFFQENKRVYEIQKSFPDFLNLIIVSMSMGKSLNYAFKAAIKYQNTKNQKFYNDMYNKIFVLGDPKSGFCAGESDVFYNFMLETRRKTSSQLAHIKNFRTYIVTKKQSENRRKAVVTPVWIQCGLMLVLYMGLQVWLYLNGTFSLSVFLITGAWYALGLLFMFLQGSKSDKKV